MMPTNGGAALRTERVTRQYQMGAALIRAVDEVSLVVGTAEFLALLGSSGSGKSTLLNLMAGLDRPTSGAILAHDRNLAEMNALELARYRSRTVGMPCAWPRWSAASAAAVCVRPSSACTWKNG